MIWCCDAGGDVPAGAVEHHGEMERAAAVGRALDLEVAMHGAGKAAHLYEAQSGAAEPLRDLLALLNGGPEQSADLGVAHADAAVGYGKRQAQLAARKR